MTRTETAILSIYLLLSGIEIAAESVPVLPIIYIVKPMLMLVLMLFWLEQPARSRFLMRAVFLAVGFSMAGDILLMVRGANLFVYGLVAFLFAHVAYLAALLHKCRFRQADLILLAPAVVAGASILYLIWPGLPPPLRLPVGIYAVMLSAMFWRAFCAAFWSFRGPLRWLGFLGGGLFLLSDTMIAVNRFVEPFAGSRVWIMTTYLLAQVLLTLMIAHLNKET